MNPNNSASAALKDKWTRFDDEPSEPSCFVPFEPSASGANQAAPRASFTPGPWLVEFDDEWTLPDGTHAQWGHYLISANTLDHESESYYRIGSVSNINNSDQNAANARLIAAAPTLYAELNHAAMLLTLAAFHLRSVDFEGDRFDLLAEAERFDAVIEGVRG